MYLWLFCEQNSTTRAILEILFRRHRMRSINVFLRLLLTKMLKFVRVRPKDVESLPITPKVPNGHTKAPCTASTTSHDSGTKSSMTSNGTSPAMSPAMTPDRSPVISPATVLPSGSNGYGVHNQTPVGKKRTKGRLKHSYFDRVADDIITKILAYLPTKYLCRSSRVCRRWHRLAWQPSLWSSLKITGKHTDVDSALSVLICRLCSETPYVCLTLQRIVLNGCERLTDKGLRLISERCPELLHLELKGCNNVSNEVVFGIVSKCASLDYLDVTGCQHVNCMNFPMESTTTSPTAPPFAESAPRQTITLRHLDMTDCISLDDNGLRTIAMNCPALVNIYLRRCIQISDIGVQNLTNECMMLKEVSISDCHKVTDCALRELSRLESHLRYLSVAKCELITDMGVHAIAKSCFKLRYLNVRGCVHVTDKSLEALARGCPRLRSLDVGKCPSVSDRGLVSVVTNCPSLRKLSIKGCNYVTDVTVRTLAQCCPHELQQLNVQECEELSREAYRLLKRHCRQCIIEHTNPAFY
ncbi:uncharacterized protein [Amphiura filiformis]|uniref:uncharacterized protein isoform X2 n=1 Tax=Amphiura filiformis TaxID=82378 RepID=UPI003B2278BD